MTIRSTPLCLAAMLSAGALLMTPSTQANMQQTEMEVITITYEGSAHYAVNQHSTERLSEMKTHHNAFIPIAARSHSLLAINTFIAPATDVELNAPPR